MVDDYWQDGQDEISLVTVQTQQKWLQLIHVVVENCGVYGQWEGFRSATLSDRPVAVAGCDTIAKSLFFRSPDCTLVPI